jgi:hypothetical protein
MAGFVAMQFGFGILAMVVKGFSVGLILAVSGVAAFGMTLATWGHPIVVYSQWRTPPRRLPMRQQLRIVAVLLLVVAAAIPFWLRLTP